METPEAIIILICFLSFFLVVICTCLLRSTVLEDIKKRLTIDRSGRQSSSDILTDKETKETFVVSE